MARLAGFEPTTPWFVARYSIQLSYSRITKDREFSMKPILDRPPHQNRPTGQAPFAASAVFIRSAMVRASILSMMLARWASTVLMLMFRSSAICLFRRPATMRSST
jgi:hypothetical protein